MSAEHSEENGKPEFSNEDHVSEMTSTMNEIGAATDDCLAQDKDLGDANSGRYIHPEDRGVIVRRIKTLRGPNIFAYIPVLQVTLDIGEYEHKPSDEFPGFAQRLLNWLPGLQKHTCSLHKEGGFVERLRRGTYLAHITEHVAIELQNEMGFDVAFGRARGTGEEGVYNVIIEYAEEVPARKAIHEALHLVLAAMHNEAYDIEAEIERLRDIAERHKLGPSSAAIIGAARKRDIPVVRLRDTSGLVQLGWGIHQKRVSASITSKTSSIAVDICQEKRLTNQMLGSLGLPTPIGAMANSPSEAWDVAREIGLPVVVKPSAGNQGKGVSVNLRTIEEIMAAFDIADDFGPVMVERFLEGEDYRMLVVNCKLVAAARREPALVLGDGEHTIQELVEITNRDPRRRPGHGGALTLIEINDAAKLVLEQQGFTADSVPAHGQQVHLRSNSNLSTGGTSTDVTDEVHPETARAVELAAQFLGLDVAGIDVICKDITKPLMESGGIVEVNAAPGLRMHMHPAKGKSRDVGAAIVEMLYPNTTPSRIPLIAVTGTNGKTTVTRLIAHMYRTARKTVGMTCTDGVYINENRIMSGDSSGPKSAQAILLHPQVEAAVLETARGGILREGLAFDKCSVGLVTNIAADHLGVGGVNTVEELARVKRVVIEAVAEDGVGVLNAEDPRVAEMASSCNGEVIYFAKSAENPIVAKHIAKGRRAVILTDQTIELVMGSNSIELVDLANVGFTMQGKLIFQVENALAATAAAWAADLSPSIIAQALTSFQTDAAKVPGRFNLREINGIEVILDYGHNPAAVRALMEAAKAIGERPTHLVVGLPGDRRDEDIKESMAATVPYVQAYYLHDQEDRREREENAVPHLMQEVIPEGVPNCISRDQDDAILTAWRSLKPGDRLIIIADKVDATLKMIDKLAKESTPAPEAAPASTSASTPAEQPEMGAVSLNGKSAAAKKNPVAMEFERDGSAAKKKARPNAKEVLHSSNNGNESSYSAAA